MAHEKLDLDKQLIPMLKIGDDTAFSTLYHDYAAMLYGVIFRIVHEKTDSENVLQDSFIKVWENVRFYNSEKGKFATWLIKIARNTAIDFTRSKYYSQKRKNQNFENLKFQEMVFEASYNTPEDSLGLKQLVEKLTPAHRIIIEMMYFDGYTQQEIADSFGIPVGTVKTRTRLAMKELRHFYELN